MLLVAFGLLAGLASTSPARAAASEAVPADRASGAAGPRNPKITFYFGLKRPERRARAAFAAVGDPGSATYRRFLDLGEAAQRYGASRRTKVRFRRVLRRHGLRSRVHRSGLFARVRGSVRRLERTFGVRIRRQRSVSPPRVDIYSVAGDRPLRLPKRLRPVVREVVPSYWRSPRRLRRRSPGEGRSPAAEATGPVNAGTWTDGCDAAKATGAYSFEQVRNAYGIEALGPGVGASVAILNVEEGATAGDIADAAECFGLPALRSRTLLTVGQARAFGHIPPFSVEPQMDLALVRGMAPRLRSAAFTQSWSAPELWFLAAVRVLALPNPPDAFSISYGECEREIRGRRGSRTTRAGARLLDSVLLRLGLVGVGTFAASGDFGSTCNGRPFPGVTWPASSRYVTAVGGTRLVLERANSRVDEVVWNDLEWLAPDAGGGAGGGGLSAVAPRPPYQRGLGIAGKRRAVPDVAAHASLFPGWPVVIARNWLEASGTSASTPLVAGTFAAQSASEQAAGRPPLGPVNGLLYELYASAPETLFDIVSGANGYDRRVPARTAGPGYDLASGLGVPRFDRLAAALPPPAP